MNINDKQTVSNYELLKDAVWQISLDNRHVLVIT